jgi:hypothetical protein
VRHDLQAAGEAVARRLVPNEPPERTEVPLAVNRIIGNQAVAWMHVHTYPNETITQRQSAQWSDHEIGLLDALINLGVAPGLAQSGASITRWHGTRRITNRNSMILLVSHYERTGIQDGPSVTAFLARAFASSDSFTLIAGFHSERSAIFRTVVLEMIESLRFG